MSNALQKALEARQKQAEATMSTIQTGAASSIPDAIPTAGAVMATGLTAEDAKEAFKDEELPADTYCLLEEVRQLLMPGGFYLKGDERNLVYPLKASHKDRLAYFAEQGKCVKVN